MEESLTLILPKKDVEAFVRVFADVRFIDEAERGDAEIAKGKCVTLEQVKEHQSPTTEQ